jgi:hypothetical protein
MKIKILVRIALIFSLLLVVIAVYFLFLDNSGSINPMVKDFSFGRIDNITEIHLTEKSYSITLTKSKAGWLADGEFKVKEQLPELFLQTINSINVKAPASKEIRDKLREELLNSKHIDIFKGNHKVCSYYILFDSANTRETFLMKKWAKLPLEAEIPGLQFPIANLYHCDLAYWRAKYIFPLSAENIEWVSFENKTQPSASFRLERTKDSEISIRSATATVLPSKVDQIAAHDYFASITKVQYIKEAEVSDSLDLMQSGMQSAELIIKVKSIKKDVIEFKFLPYYRKSITGSVKNPDLFIGFSSLSSTPLIGRYVDFDPVIRNLNYFKNK